MANKEALPKWNTSLSQLLEIKNNNETETKNNNERGRQRPIKGIQLENAYVCNNREKKTKNKRKQKKHSSII